MRSLALIAAALLLAACGGREDASPEPGDTANQARGGLSAEPAGSNAPAQGAGSNAPTSSAPAAAAAAGWDLQSSGEGVALVRLTASGGAAVRLWCPSGRRELLVNVPGFRAVGSEERLSVGSGGNAVALVADTRGDRQRGGVSGTGAVPSNLAALVSGPVSVNYGAQNSGPHPGPPRDLARAFAAACSEGAAVPRPDPRPSKRPGACMMQGEQRLRNPPLRAVGTEPFWGARIEGRCVTYSHPEDQQGTRVWTRFAPGSGGGGTWSGALGGKAFELRVRPQPGCSDGMSDKRYPLAAELLVHGERRRGCAERA